MLFSLFSLLYLVGLCLRGLPRGRFIGCSVDSSIIKKRFSFIRKQNRDTQTNNLNGNIERYKCIYMQIPSNACKQIFTGESNSDLSFYMVIQFWHHFLESLFGTNVFLGLFWTDTCFDLFFGTGAILIRFWRSFLQFLSCLGHVLNVLFSTKFLKTCLRLGS